LPLSSGLTLVDGEKVQEVQEPPDASSFGIASWKVKGRKEGRQPLSVQLVGSKVSQAHPVWIFKSKADHQEKK
jgi:hypothetical protein